MLIFALLFLLYPLPVHAFELTYDGQKEFQIGTNLTVISSPLFGNIYDTTWNFSQSFQLHFQGEDDMGYIRGYVTDDPTSEEDVYLDVNLGPFKLQWDQYKEGFLHPSWFDLEQNFQGLRLSYTGAKDETSFLAAMGTNHLREEDFLVEPAEIVALIGLKHYPVIVSSVQAWLDGVPLRYGVDYYVHVESSTLQLLNPVTRYSHLHVRYLEEGNDYLVFGTRYDRHIDLKDPNRQMESGLIYLQNRQWGLSQNMLGAEMYYRPKSWWTLEANAGVVGQDPFLVNPDGSPMTDAPALYPNWRLSNQFRWANTNLSVDYQMVSDRFQDLLNLGQEGHHLRLSGLYQGKQLMVKHQEDYHWLLDGKPKDNQADLELLWLDPHWVPYFFYSQYHWNNETADVKGMISQQAIAELGYQVELKKHPGALTYFGGVDLKGSSEDENIMDNAKPYLGVRYQKGPNQGVSGRIFGKNGRQFAQLELNGDWEQGPISLKSRFKYLPEYYQLESYTAWKGYPADVSLNVVQSRYFSGDREYLNLDLNLNLPARKKGESDSKFWLKLLREHNQKVTTQTYGFGLDKELYKNYFGQFSLDLGVKKHSYTAGLQTADQYFNYDLSFTRTADKVVEKDPVTGEEIEVWKNKNRLALTAQSGELVSFSSDFEINSTKDTTFNLDGEYPLLDNVTVGAHYTWRRLLVKGVNDHKLTVRTVYRF